MSLILNIDTSTDIASICLAEKGQLLTFAKNEEQQDHAAWLHPAIANLLQERNYSVHDLEAVAVTIGPGSYTGLRVGLAAAKGFCYALRIPLIAVDTLELIAFSVKDELEEIDHLICPMIDARRSEVFTALYDKTLMLKEPAHALVIDKDSFQAQLATHKILFCGNGSWKMHNNPGGENVYFSVTKASSSHLGQLSCNFFHANKFADLAYTEPYYVKEFHMPVRKPLV